MLVTTVVSFSYLVICLYIPVNHFLFFSMAKFISSSPSSSSKMIREAAKKVTSSQASARVFLKSAGIMTPKGNLSPKYK